MDRPDPSDADLLEAALDVLDGNWTGRSTVPSPSLYPHQWSWDSAFIAIGLSWHHQERAQTELESLLAAQWTDGRVPHLRIVSRDPALALRLAEAMGEKLQDARERIADFAFRDVRGRVANLVLTLLERERRISGDAVRDRVGLGLTHRELADLIGTRRESVTLALNALERERLLRIEDHLLVVVDEDGLRANAE